MNECTSLRFRMRRPLAGFSLLFGAGCGLAARWEVCPSWLFSIMTLVLATAWMCRRRSSGVYWLHLAVVCAGLLHGGVFRAVWLSASPVLSGPASVELCGRIKGDPVCFEKKGLPQTSLTVLGQINGNIRARIRVVVPGNQIDTFHHAQTWRFCGRFYPYRHRAKYSGALYLKAGSSHAVLLREAPLFFLGCRHLREKGSDLLGCGLEDFSRTHGLLKAMLLGCRAEVKGALREHFIDSGTLHLFALSGLHIGIIALLLIGLLKWTGLPRPYWGLVLIPVLLVYVVMTGMRPSALRAFVMAAVYWGGSLVRRRPDALLALALAAWLVLLLDPLQVTDPGFLLSFCVVGLLIVGCARFRAWLLPEDYALEGRSLRGRLLFFIRSLVLSSTVAWAASFPLTLYYFGRASLVGPLANLVAVPLSFIIVLTGGLSLVFGGLGTGCAEILNHANRIFLAGLCGVTAQFAAVPCGTIQVASMAFWQVGCWYVGLAFLLTGKQKSRRLFGAGLLLLFAVGFFVRM